MSSAAGPDQDAAEPHAEHDVAALLPMVRRIVRARVGSHPAAEDVVQETVARVLGAADRIEPGMLEPYTIATVRNLIASLWKQQDLESRHRHRLVDLTPAELPESEIIADEDRSALLEALAHLSERDRATLLAHEVAGQDTRSLAQELDSSPGAVAAQLNRTRARLRVEYLLAMEPEDVPTERCRPVLLAISGGDRRRQNEVDAAQHLLECGMCRRISGPLLERGKQREDEIRISIQRDPDVVAARQGVRALAERLGFSGTDLTMISTAVSEVARNIVKFAGEGEVAAELIDQPGPGLRVVARDAGPGIADVELALEDGYSTYRGLGLGLGGARRLMDEFTLESEPGRGTTVTMTKWRRRG